LIRSLEIDTCAAESWIQHASASAYMADMANDFVLEHLRRITAELLKWLSLRYFSRRNFTPLATSYLTHNK